MTSLDAAAPTTAPAVLADRLRRRPEAPLLTWYDLESGERIELSTATFANWVAKTANLMRDGIGVPDAPRVAIALPAHWQAFGIAHAVWALGGTVVLAPFGAALEPVDLVVRSADPTEVSVRGDDELVLALRALGVPGPGVPPPAYDYDREVPVHGDHFVGSPVAPDVAALEIHGDITTQAGVIDAAIPGDPNQRGFVHVPDRALTPVITAVLTGALSNGAVLAVGPATAERLARLRTDERATA